MEGLETRAVDFDVEPSRDGRTLSGYAAVFRSKTRVPDRNGDFEEILMPGFADRSLKEHGMPRLQWDHGKDARVGTVPIGKWTEWRSDGRGYAVTGRLFDNPVVEPVRQAIAEGAVDGLSFRFKVSKGGDRWERRRGSDGMDLRHVIDADVHEAGPVVFPAYKDAKVSIRSLALDVPILRSYSEDDDLDEDRVVGAYALTWRAITEHRGDDGAMYRVRFHPHAFDEWLAEWRADGQPPWPILREHGQDGHRVPVGHLIDTVTDSYGLWTLAEYHDTDEGRAALNDILNGTLRGYSHHSKIVDSEDVDGVVEVRSAVLAECGPCERPFDRGATISSAGGVEVETRAEFESPAELTEFVRIQTGRPTEDLLSRIEAEQRDRELAAQETLAEAFACAREVRGARMVATEEYRSWAQQGRRADALYRAQEADRAEAEAMADLREMLTFSRKRSPLGEDPMVRQVLDAVGAPKYNSPFRGRDAAKAMLELAGFRR